ncbi:major capsid protein [Microbacterium sp. GXS0129]|uniref:major capsid protein n=1 Tax=Microbacterium sp. GXS0129 TaxID=3377836 RepID=UPI00383AF15D
MANIMSLKTIMNRPSRNGFDLSTKRNFTAKCGELLPVWSSEVIPGDKFTIDLKAFTRTAPINTAAYARVREYFDFYYVPYHLLWNRANEVLSQMDFNQQHATSLNQMPPAFSGELPYVTTEQIGTYLKTLHGLPAPKSVNYFGYDRAQLSVKLLEYLQYGNFESYIADAPQSLNYNLDVNIMGLLAYQKIYSDYFRNQQWEKPNPSTFNCDYMTGSSDMNVQIPVSSSDSFFANYNMFDLRYCNWQKDLYHGVLPQAQYGDTAVVPLDMPSISGSVKLTESLGSTGDVGVLYGTFSGGNNSLSSSPLEGAPDAKPNAIVGPAANTYTLGSFVSAGTYPVELSSSSSSLSILALRQYEFLQKWKEIAQSGDQDYKGITKRIFGVDVPNGLSDKCQYLGGTSSSLDINEVVNQNITGDNGAAIAGKGVGLSDGKINFQSDGQYGIVMCIYHCVPLVDYTVDYISPAFTRVNAEDFANPVFDRVGMQGVSSVNIMNSAPVGKPFPDGATPFFFGYAPRYIDYKTAIDLSFGAFKRDLRNWVLSYNAQSILNALTPDGVADASLPQDGTAESGMNYTFFKVNPNLVDPIFAVQADSTMNTDQFWVSSFFDVKVVRNLDVDGLPY